MVEKKARNRRRTYITRYPEWFQLLKHGKSYTVEEIMQIGGIASSTARTVMNKHKVPKKWAQREDGSVINVYTWDKSIYEKLISRN